eukprot:873729-Pyramimonas_sp.AAC.1
MADSLTTAHSSKMPFSPTSRERATPGAMARPPAWSTQPAASGEAWGASGGEPSLRRRLRPRPAAPTEAAAQKENDTI